MSSTTQDRLFEHFAEASGGATQQASSLTDLTEGLANALTAATHAASTAPEAGQNVQATSAASTASGSSGGSKVWSIAQTVLESGFGLAPLIGGLLGLFGGGGEAAPPPLVKYAMPERMQFEGADTDSGMSDADYDQMGMPRPYSGGRDTTGAGPAGAAISPGSGATASAAAAPQIQVNVQTMDAQSFLDHSSEIAQAVRQAMLNSSSINDVVNDL